MAALVKELILEAELRVTHPGDAPRRRLLHVEDRQRGEADAEFQVFCQPLVEAEVGGVLPLGRVGRFLRHVLLVEEFKL
jgi:hypothetical protein